MSNPNPDPNPNPNPNPNSNPNNKNSTKVAAQFKADAKLLAEFEHSEQNSDISFNYNKSVKCSPEEPVPDEQICAYLSKIQRGGFIQPFGCLLAVEEPSFRILAYSENTIDFLGFNNSLPSPLSSEYLLGFDARKLFTDSSSHCLVKAVAAPDISLLNPIWVVSEGTQRPFLAILHRNDMGIVLDLEPAKQGDPAFSVDGVVRSQKFALHAISRLQSLPRGDINLLCDNLAKDVKYFTGYDRVMVYKFHEDDHGEVMSEAKSPELEPYLGLHYPATDIPQVVRFLFKKNHVRMICNSFAKPVGIIQSKGLKQPLILINSTLRAPHGCHTEYMTNMGSVASLVMAIIVNETDSMKLWGLVSCHNLTPRYLPFPIRYGCEFIMQAFGSQLGMELQLVLHNAEKKIIKTQALLSDTVLKDVPFGIITKSPNIMDLVNCDGAAFYYNGVCRVLGVTPSELQIKDITEWLLGKNEDITVWSTNSLADSGYTNVSELGKVVCGVAIAKSTSKDFLFWFRRQTEKEVKWGGAKHHDRDKDDDEKMHPRSSFKTFLEVVKDKSLPWEVWEINAIRSLQHTMQGAFQEIENDSAQMNIHSQETELEMDKLTLALNEMTRLFETAAAPIFAIDTLGNINRWNSKIAELTGLPANEAIGKSLVSELVDDECQENFEEHLSHALQGEVKNIELRLKTVGKKRHHDFVFIVVNACSWKDYRNNIESVWFVCQDITEAKVVMAKYARLEEDYKYITQSLNPLIPPMFISDKNARCSEWNASMERLTGWDRSEVVGKMIPGEIFGSLCRMENLNDVTKLMILLYQTLCSQENENIPFAFFNREGTYVGTILTSNKRIDMSGNIVGCFCFLQTVPPSMQQTFDEVDCSSRLKNLEYIRQEIKTPLHGIQFSRKLLESTCVSDDQKQLLETIDACERQMMAIIEASSTEKPENGVPDLNQSEFLLETVMDAVVCQIMMSLVAKNLHLRYKLPEEIRTLSLYGDQIRLQQVLSNFLVHMVNHTPTPNGCVEVRVELCSELIEDGHECVQLQFRMIHTGEGIPVQFIKDMFEEDTRCISQEGFGLCISHKLLKKMNGHIQYVREPSNCYFLISITFSKTASERGNTSEVKNELS